LSLDSLILQRPDALVAEVDDEVMMMHPESGEYFGLNPVAGYIWSLLVEPRKISEVCDAVQAEFEVDRDRCVRDTIAFVNQMVDDDLLLVSNSQSLAS